MSPASIGSCVARGHQFKFALAVAICWSLTSAAWAQQPAAPKKPAARPPVAKPVPKPPTAEEKALAAEKLRLKEVTVAVSRLLTKTSQSLRAGQIPEAEKADVDQLFKHYVDLISSFGAATESPEHRQDMRRNVRTTGNAPDKSAHVYVNNLLKTELLKVISDDKFPVHGRYNCMLALGELNEQEPTTGGSGPVKPFPGALPELHKYAVQPDAPPAVKVAALVGLQRHVKTGITDKKLEGQIVSDMAKLVKQPTPADTTAEGHDWMRRQAIDIINTLKQPGANNEVPTTLAAVVLDKENPMQLRLDAARAVGHFKLPANAMGPELTPVMGGLTLELLQNQTNRRALRYNLRSLQIGLKGENNQGGLLVTAAGPDRKRADELSQKVGIWLEFVEKVTDPVTVAAEIPNEAALFEQWLLGEENATGVNTGGEAPGAP